MGLTEKQREDLRHIRGVVQDSRYRIFHECNLRQVTVGFKLRSGKITSDLGIVAFAQAKLSRNQLNEGTTQDFTPTFIPGSSVGLLHTSCFGEILEQVCQTLLPVPFERVIPVKPRLPVLVLKKSAQVRVKTPIEVPGK